MNFQDMKNKAMQALGKNPDKARSGVDKAAEYAKGRFGNEQRIDSAKEKAKGYIGNQGERGGSGSR